MLYEIKTVTDMANIPEDQIPLFLRVLPFALRGLEGKDATDAVITWDSEEPGKIDCDFNLQLDAMIITMPL